MPGVAMRRILCVWIAGWMAFIPALPGARARGAQGGQAARMSRPEGLRGPGSGRDVPWAVRMCRRKGAKGRGRIPEGRAEVPGTPTGTWVDKARCPRDSDRDGVCDGVDRCEDTPAGAWVDRRGCPGDSDGDGVPDGLDLCPGTSPQALVNADGCAFDLDGDGVLDGIDRCPDTPMDALVDERGCSFDTDGDGVPDGPDLCPATAPRAKVDPLGCSPGQATGEVLQRIRFRLGSTEIEAGAYSVLEKVAQMLKAHPSMIVEIGGHTDSSGEARFNRWISLRRAETVKSYLVSKGVPARQVVTRGYGELEPIATNRTPAGRAANRRIEIRILSR